MNYFQLLFAALSMTSCATGAVLLPVSYDTLNGNSGLFPYHDRSYTGTGNTFSDNSPLTGGLGDLTDGYIAVQNWNVAENPAGTGPYVGWYKGSVPQPKITFRFGGPVTIDTIVIYADDANSYGGVNVPASVDVGLEGGPYVTYILPSPAGSEPAAFTLSGLSLSGSSVDLRFGYSDQWIMVSEVTFNGASQQTGEVPEPSTALLAVTAFAGAALWRRRF